MISGDIQARRCGHTFRHFEMTRRIVPLVLLGSCAAGSYAIRLIGGGTEPLSDESWWWPLSAYLSGFLIPPLAMVSLVLVGLAFWENTAAIPLCRRCKSVLAYRSGVTTFAYSKTSWRHASSDCLAARRENLWEDAAKLLSIHGELRAPKLEEKTAYPPLRLHLDYYVCGACGHETAILTTEDRIAAENGTASWRAREEYEGACKEKNRTIAKRSQMARLKTALNALRRAARQTAEPVHPVLVGILIIAACLAGMYYYPQLGVVLGLPGYRALITIQTDPPGPPVTVDHRRVQTPYTFDWTYGTAHKIDFDQHVQINGRPYIFERFGRLGFPTSPSSWPQAFINPDFEVRVDTVRDRWGRLVSHPEQTTYSIQYRPQFRRRPERDDGAGDRRESHGEIWLDERDGHWAAFSTHKLLQNEPGLPEDRCYLRPTGLGGDCRRCQGHDAEVIQLGARFVSFVDCAWRKPDTESWNNGIYPGLRRGPLGLRD